MGLEPDDSSSFRVIAQAGLPLLLAVISLLVALAGDDAREWLRYERAALEQGEAWRWLSGHISHLGWSHLVLNLVALAAIWWLVGAFLGGWPGVAAAACIVAGIDAGFWWLMPELAWYVGLSGLLHGLLAAGLVAGWPARRTESLLLAVGLVGKLLWEQAAGALPGSTAAAGGDVIVNAHLYGAVAGALAGSCLRISVRRAARI